MKNIIITLLNITTSIFAISCSVGGKNNPVKVNTPILPVTELATQTTVIEKEFVSELNAIQNIEVRARVGGYMEKIYVDEGKEVKQGQVIFKISDDEFEADVAKARADLKTAEAEAKTSEVELTRMKLLVDKKVVSSTELQMARANYDAINAGIDRAKSALQNALTRLSYTTIKAPFNGTVDRIPFKLGSYVEAGSLLTTVSDTRFINAYF
ncbi:MAG TPA: efflux RND transporter periplasmic adaptor subunit, partial [Cytophagaceae bacterium]